jgi:hypothetical protein
MHRDEKTKYCRVKSFDVAILGHVRFGMTQGTLNDEGQTTVRLDLGPVEIVIP